MRKHSQPSFDVIAASRVAERLRAVFPPIKAPTGFELAPHECEECPDCSWLRENLSGEVWTTLSSDGIEGLHQNLSLLSSKGFRALFPACLVYALNPDAEWRNDVVEWALFAVFPNKSKTWDHYFHDWSEVELRAIAAWCSFVVENADFYSAQKEELLKGLQTYWIKYLDS